MDWEQWKTRFGHGSVKVFLGAVIISAIGLAAYAMMQVPPPLPDGDLVPVSGEALVEVSGVKLTPINSELPARATFRVQFEEPIVEPEQVGESGQVNPLAFEPPMKGEFIWDSTRSGSFTPASGFELDARFVVSLSEAVIKKTGLKFRRQFHTPPMQVEAKHLRSLNGDRPFSAALAFNVAMDAGKAEAFVEFRSKNGSVIPASIEPMTKENLRWLEAPDEPWSMRMVDEGPELVGHPTRVLIHPRRILSPGMEWRLLLKKGLPSGDGNRLSESVSYPLGVREPMQVERIFAENRLNHGRSIQIRLSHALPQELTAGQLAKWLVVEQSVEVNTKKSLRFVQTQVEFKVDISGSWIELNGGFELNQKYRVRMKPGLPSKLGLTLAKEKLQAVVFNPLPSRVYLPGTYFSQAVNGNRHFSFVSVNNRAIRLRVKRIAPEQLTMVSEVYKNEYMAKGSFNWSGSWGWRNGHPLSFDLIPGTQVCDRVFKPKAAVDEAVKKEFVWDELLGNETPGPLFVSVECVGRDGTVSSAQVIAQLTDVGLAWKEAGGGIHIQAFSLRTAKPLAGAKVQVLGSDNRPRVTGRTDLDGQTVLLSARAPRVTRWLSVSHGNDHHAIQMDLSFAEVPLWSFDVNYGWGEAETRKTHLFTDRLIYQPGDMVRLKGHVRDWADGKIELPAGETLTVSARDWRGHTFFSRPVTVSEQGAFDANIQLAKGVSGSHTISVGEQYHYIDVFEYEPATFKLRFTGRRQFAPDEAIEIPLNASFYFGKPLAGAKAVWSFTGHHTVFSPTGWDQFMFGETDGSHTTELSAEGILSPKGGLTIRPEVTGDPTSPMPMEGNLSVRITNANGQSISGDTAVIRHASDFYFALRELPRVRWAKQPIPLQVVAVKSDSNAAAVGQSFTATLKKVEWHSVKIKGAGGVARYKNERKTIRINEVDLKTIARDADPVPSSLVPPEAGEYQLELRGADSKGRPVQNITTFYVRGKKSLAWDYRNEFQMEMVPDRAIYHTGDTATILLKTPISGRAVVTVEREKVLRSFFVEVTGNAPAIEVPLREGDAPNVFVSVMLLRGSADSTRKIKTAEYRIGYCELTVERPNSRLNVEAELSQSNYQPGEEVEVALVVNDHAGAPVPGTEVALYAVDEGVLDLTGYKAPDLHSFFYAPRTLQVETSTSFAFMHTEDPSRVAFGNKGHIIGGGGDAGKLRHKFLAVAFWNAALRTDAKGRIRASFTAPDSLTRYRLFAVAHSGDRFGATESGFRIHQPLMVESVLPRFGRVGDQLTAKAMVYNQTDQAIEAEVKLELDNSITANGKLERRITIPANGTMAVNFPIQFTNVGKARTVWRVRCPAQPNLADARESFIDIRHVAPLRRAIHFERISDAKSDLLKPVDPALRQAEGKYTISLSTSPMAELETATDYLLLYPHGCVEQTSSRLLPWLLLDEFEDVFPRFKSDSPEAQEIIEQSINRLLSMQDYSGGLGYWPGRSATLFASAYGGMVLAIAEDRGHDVPDQQLKLLVKYLTKKVKGPLVEKRDGEYCLALYTLALLGEAQPAYHERMFKVRDQLSSSGRALLAMAVAKVDGPEEMVRDLLKPAQSKQRGFRYFGNSSQLLGMRLLAMCQHDAESPAAAQLAGKIVASMREGHWGTTFANAWVMYGMSVFARLQPNDEGPANGTILWGSQARPFKLDAKQRRLKFTFANAPGPDETPMILRNPGERTLFVQVKAAMYPAQQQTKPVKQGLSIHRTYTRLKDNGKEDNAAPLRVGDLVRVTLRVDVPAPARYFAIEDGLPANLEPMNASLKTQATRVSPKNNWHVSHKVLRKDRAVFYANNLPRGMHQFKYLARVRAAGTATAPAAKVEAMYDPDIVGLTASQPIEALPLNE
ncbi:MAG: hypothetical protein H8E27_03260 [Verrucomicrobia subdivision 3 bacterium]|nr:hypothetical protein [Limisphaerales bacterium]